MSERFHNVATIIYRFLFTKNVTVSRSSSGSAIYYCRTSDWRVEFFSAIVYDKMYLMIYRLNAFIHTRM